MPDRPFQRLRRFLAELRRRNVYRVAATCLAVAFVGFQAAKLLIPSTTLPSWGDEFALARADLLEGDTASARDRLAAVRRRYEYGRPTVEGLILAALGRTDAAYDAWNQIRVWGRQSSTLRYYFSDVLDPLRDEPEFREVLRDANRGWGLTPDGSLPDSVGAS